MSIKLADQTFKYPLGIVENVLVQVGRFSVPVDFVVLEMKEDNKVPLILGRPFLNTADAIIRVKSREISLGVDDDREIFTYEKSKKHSYSTHETCFRMDVIDNDMFNQDLQEFLEEELEEEENENSFERELKELLGTGLADMVESNSNTNGDITLEEFEKMFNIEKDPSDTKKKTEEKQNGAENENLGLLSQLRRNTHVMRRNSWSVAPEIVSTLLVAPQPIQMRGIETPYPENGRKGDLEAKNEVGDEPLVKNEDGTSKWNITSPISLDLEVVKLIGSEWVAIDNPMSVNITLEDFEEYFDLGMKPGVTKVEKKGEVMGESTLEKEIVKTDEVSMKRKIGMEPKLGACKNEEYFDLGVLMNEESNEQGYERRKYGGVVGDSRERKDCSIMRKTRKWHDEWVKTRNEFDVSNAYILFDVFACRYIGSVLRSWFWTEIGGKPRFLNSRFV